MAEDIKDENLENETTEQIEEVSSDGLIPEEDQEETPSDENEAPSEEEQEESSEETQEEPTDSDSQEQEEVDEEEKEAPASIEEEPENTEEHSVQQKQSKLQKILIITIGVLAGILVLGFVLYLFGVFDPEPPKPKPSEQAAMDMNKTKEPEKYIFNPKDMNIDRLNGKLRILTKYEIIGTAEEERQKELEKNSKLSTEQINELLEAERKAKEEEARKKKEEELAKQKALEEEKKKKEEEEELARQKALEEEKKRKEQEELAKQQNPYDLLKFIQVSINEEALLSMKEDLEKEKVTISKCEDGTRTFLLIGPFNSNKDLNSIFRPIYSNITQSATKKDLARLEFNRICK